MTQTKQVITKRMAQKENVAITGTGGRIEKAASTTNLPESVPEVPKETIPTPKSKKSSRRKSK